MLNIDREGISGYFVRGVRIAIAGLCLRLRLDVRERAEAFRHPYDSARSQMSIWTMYDDEGDLRESYAGFTRRFLTSVKKSSMP